MTISENLLPEFDREMANTRKSLERVPEDKLDWKPHPNAYSGPCRSPFRDDGDHDSGVMPIRIPG